ncbi:RNA-binding protein cabeza-like isoform X3 [Macrobrachium rosenbergii]|uniref:RNA-binding protein cabeza-like isoform X3 n=1 Tax=Macrobrachium rosenbergii TaxID=79674 RepID=UPI0034D5DE37
MAAVSGHDDRLSVESPRDGSRKDMDDSRGRDDWGGGRWPDRYSDQDSGSRDRYSGSRSINSKPGDWDCPNCQFLNFASRSMCFKCRTPKDSDGFGSGGRVGGGMREMRPGDWACPKCQFHNFSSRGMCYKCNSPREGGRSVGGGMDRNNMRPGDWECNSCQFHNFASRDQCFKCNTPK